MNIQLKERQDGVLSDLEIRTTFKIPEHSFIFMKMDVDGLTVPSKRPPDAQEDPAPIRVQVPEGKTPVVCLNTGKAQFLNLNEKVKIVELDAKEVIKEKGE